MNIHWLGSNVMCIGTKLKIIWACANPQFFFGSHLLGQFFSHVFIHTEKVGPSIREVMNGIGLRVHLKIAWSKILCLIITSKKELAIQGYPLCLDAPFFLFFSQAPFPPTWLTAWIFWDVHIFRVALS